MRVIAILALSFFMCEEPLVAITSIKTTYGDTIRITNYHENGNVKSKGIQIKNFKHGKWYYYDENGFIEDIKKYKNGKEVKLYGSK